MNAQQEKQLNEVDELLLELGYDVSQEEKKVFVDVVIETLDCIGKGMPKEQVYELVHNKNAYIYVELAYFCYEQGMPKLHSSLENFHQNRNDKNVKKETFDTIFQKEKNPNVFDSAYYIASYLNERHKESIDQNYNKQKVLTVK